MWLLSSPWMYLSSYLNSFLRLSHFIFNTNIFYELLIFWFSNLTQSKVRKCISQIFNQSQACLNRNLFISLHISFWTSSVGNICRLNETWEPRVVRQHESETTSLNMKDVYGFKSLNFKRNNKSTSSQPSGDNIYLNECFKKNTFQKKRCVTWGEQCFIAAVAEP